MAYFSDHAARNGHTIFLTSVTEFCRKIAHFLELFTLPQIAFPTARALDTGSNSAYLLSELTTNPNVRLMAASELYRIPNLLSLARIALIPFLGYFVARTDKTSMIISVGLMAVAGITDGLDGYLARRLGQVSRLGIALDPVADKIFAAALIVLLIIHRGMPIWLGAIIVGRDLIILAAGSILLQGRKITLPSNLTGKYAFFSIIMLLLSYTTRFEFGVVMLTWITLALIATSLVNYGRLFFLVRANQPPPKFRDRPVYRWLRITATTLLSILWLVKWFLDVVL